MPIGWNGVSMPTKLCSVCMPIRRVNFKVRGVKWDSVPYMMEIILTNIPINCGIVDCSVNRLLYCPGKAIFIPPYDAEVPHMWYYVQAGYCVHGWERVPSDAPCTFPQGPGCFPYALFITCEFHTLVHVASCTFLSIGSWSLGLTNICIKVLFPLK